MEDNIDHPALEVNSVLELPTKNNVLVVSPSKKEKKKNDEAGASST